MSCNTATGEEAAAVLEAIPEPELHAELGSGQRRRDRQHAVSERLRLCCPRTASATAIARTWFANPIISTGGRRWARAWWIGWGSCARCKRDGYHYGLSLETHWRGAGTPEASTRISMDGLKKTLAKAGISACLTGDMEDDDTRREFLDALAAGAAGLAVGATAKSYGQIVGLERAAELRRDRPAIAGLMRTCPP